jgi:hypothetical protein
MPIMPKNKLPYSREIIYVRAQLDKYIADTKKSQTHIAIESGVKQYFVNRLIRGRVKKVNDDVRKICNYAKIKLQNGIKLTEGNERLQRALDQVWDGNDESAQVLAALIEVIGPIVIQFQGVKSSSAKGVQKHNFN